MNIVFILESSFNSGGMERMLSTISNALCLDYNVTVITAFNEGRPDFFGFCNCIKRIDLGIKRDNYPLSKMLKKEYKMRLEKQLLDQPQDIAISLGSLEYIFLPTLKDGSKKVLWFHFALNYDLKTCRISRFKAINHIVGQIKAYRRLYLAKKYDHVICLSKEDLNKWEKHVKQVSQIYNPLTINKIAPPDYSAKRVIAIGRLDPQKGFDILVSAWKQVATRFPVWSLDIYGDGELRESLQQQINNSDLANRVKLRGRTENISQEYARHSIMVLSSRYEGFGLVLCEASACGIPSVSFDCESGPSEIIEDHKSGILVSPVGDVHMLANALCELMASEDKRRCMGQCAERLSQRFALPTIKEQWHELLHEIVK